MNPITSNESILTTSRHTQINHWLISYNSKLKTPSHQVIITKDFQAIMLKISTTSPPTIFIIYLITLNIHGKA